MERAIEELTGLLMSPAPSAVTPDVLRTLDSDLIVTLRRGELVRG